MLALHPTLISLCFVYQATVQLKRNVALSRELL